MLTESANKSDTKIQRNTLYKDISRPTKYMTTHRNLYTAVIRTDYMGGGASAIAIAKIIVLKIVGEND